MKLIDARSWRLPATVGAVAAALLLVAPGTVRAQQPGAHAGLPDSVAAAIRHYKVAVAAGDSCRRATAARADTQAVATGSAPTSGTAPGPACLARSEGLHPPTAYVVDGKLTCPSLRPSEWSDDSAAVRPDEILRIEVATDSAVLSRVRCEVPPLGIVWVTTNRPSPSSPR